MANLENFNCGFANILKEQWQIDIRLQAGDSYEAAPISAHKLVLAARSNVFKTMFESDEFKSSDGVETVTFSEMKQEELEAFVDFIYSSGSLPADKLKQHVRVLYIAADKYEIRHLRDLCRNELISSMNTSNAPDVLEIAQIPFDKVLHDAAFGFISKNLKTISNSSDDFKLFVGRQPELTVKLINAAFAIPPRPGPRLLG